MPSSTPLYHNAIKTIATSDDELLPDRPCCPTGTATGLWARCEQRGGPREKSPHGLWEDEHQGWRPPCGHAGFFVLPRGPGVGGCDVLGHSSHWSFNETKPGSLSGLSNITDVSTGQSLGLLASSPKCLESRPRS